MFRCLMSNFKRVKLVLRKDIKKPVKSNCLTNNNNQKEDQFSPSIKIMIKNKTKAHFQKRILEIKKKILVSYHKSKKDKINTHNKRKLPPDKPTTNSINQPQPTAAHEQPQSSLKNTLTAKYCPKSIKITILPPIVILLQGQGLMLTRARAEAITKTNLHQHPTTPLQMIPTIETKEPIQQSLIWPSIKSQKYKNNLIAGEEFQKKKLAIEISTTIILLISIITFSRANKSPTVKILTSQPSSLSSKLPFTPPLTQLQKKLTTMKQNPMNKNE